MLPEDVLNNWSKVFGSFLTIVFALMSGLTIGLCVRKNQQIVKEQVLLGQAHECKTPWLEILCSGILGGIITAGLLFCN